MDCSTSSCYKRDFGTLFAHINSLYIHHLSDRTPAGLAGWLVSRLRSCCIIERGGALAVKMAAELGSLLLLGNDESLDEDDLERQEEVPRPCL